MTHLPGEKERRGRRRFQHEMEKNQIYPLPPLPCWRGWPLVAQVAVLFVMVNEFTAHFDYFYWFCIFVSFLATVWIVSDRSEPGYKIAWLVVILPFPVFGGIPLPIAGRQPDL